MQARILQPGIRVWTAVDKSGDEHPREAGRKVTKVLKVPPPGAKKVFPS